MKTNRGSYSHIFLTVLCVFSNIVLDRVRGDDEYNDIYLDCKLKDDANISHIWGTTHPYDPAREIILYHSSRGLSWCEAFKQCQAERAVLLTVASKAIQATIQMFDVANHTMPAWISGTRKNHSNLWTWVTDPLTDCDEVVPGGFSCTDDKQSVEKEYGAAAGTNTNPSSYVLIAEDLKPTGRAGYCVDSDDATNDNGEGWFVLQNECNQTDARLRTLAEFRNLPPGVSIGAYSLSLMYRPWIWLSQEDGEDLNQSSFSPMFYTKWLGTDRTLAGDADCLTVQLNTTEMYWKEENCEGEGEDEGEVNYFFCEELPIETTTTEPMTTVPEGSTDEVSTTQSAVNGTGKTDGSTEDDNDINIGLVVGCSVAGGVVLVIIIVVTVVLVKRKNKTSSIKGSEGHNGPQTAEARSDDFVNPYGVTDLNAKTRTGNEYSEAFAYKPGRQQSAQYEEAGFALQNVNTAPPATGPTGNSEYARAQAIPGDDKNANPAIYSEVSKPKTNGDDDEGDVTILVDNQQYGQFGFDNPASTDNNSPQAAFKPQVAAKPKAAAPHGNTDGFADLKPTQV